MSRFEEQDAAFEVEFSSDAQQFNADGESTVQDMDVAFLDGAELFNADFQDEDEFSTEFGEVQTIGSGDVSVSVEQTETGAVITVTDKEGTSTATVYNGKAGPAGADGRDGADGKDGQDGKDGVDGQDGYTPVKGVDYFDGKDGADGKDGYTPQKGIDYFDGQDGANGKDGADGYTPVKGVDYFDGEDGQDGANGKDGVSVTHSWNGTVLTVTSASGTSSADLKGERGLQGIQGVTGKDGSPGANGKDGVSCTHSWSGTTLTVTSASGTSSANLKGDKGDTGATGATGAPGAAGKTPVKGTDYYTAADRLEFFKTLYPVKAVYTTTTNTNPATLLGFGTWELIGKSFENKQGNSSSKYFTPNETNVSASTVYYRRSGQTLWMRFYFKNAVELGETDVELGTFNLAELGITAMSSAKMSFIPFGTDGGNGVALVSIATDGVAEAVDVAVRGSTTSIATGKTFYGALTLPMRFEDMLDADCDQFHWKRTA